MLGVEPGAAGNEASFLLQRGQIALVDQLSRHRPWSFSTYPKHRLPFHLPGPPIKIVLNFVLAI